MQLEHHTWKIIGMSPLVQNNPHTMWMDPLEENPPEEDPPTKKTKGKEKPKTAPRKEKPKFWVGDTEAFKIAKKGLYVNESDDFYHPGSAFMNTLWDASAQRYFEVQKYPDRPKNKETKQLSCVSVLATAIRVVEDEFILYDGSTLNSKSPRKMGHDPKRPGWRVDKRRGINHNSPKKVGIICIRPIWKDWGGFLTLAIETSFVDPTKFLGTLTELLNIAGAMFGIGCGRYRYQGRKPTLGDTWGGFGGGKFKAELKN